MPYLVAEKVETENNLWHFRGIFGTRKKAREKLGSGKFLFKEIELNSDYPDGIIPDEMQELK